MLVRIGAGIRFDSLTELTDRGRSQLSSDSRPSSQGSEEHHQAHKMKLGCALVLEILLDHLG